MVELNIYEKRKYSLWLMIIASMIWGMAFIAQSEGAKHIGPFFFNASRFWIGALTILPMSLFRTYKSTGKRTFWTEADDKKLILKGSFVDGIVIFIVLGLQQTAMKTTSPGKAGFLMSLCIIFVPVIGIFLGKRVKLLQWAGVASALFGVALISLNDEMGVNIGDILMIGSAFSFAISTMISGHFNKTVESLKYTMFRFVFAAALSTIVSILFESVNMTMIMGALPSILFAGVFSSGIAYTLQSLGQIHLDDLTTTIALSTESVFAALFAWLILGEVLSLRELIGCIMVFASVIFVQLLQGKDSEPPHVI